MREGSIRLAFGPKTPDEDRLVFNVHNLWMVRGCHLAAGSVVRRFSGRTERTAQIKHMRNLPNQRQASCLRQVQTSPMGLAENDADAMRESNIVLDSSPKFGLGRG